MCVVPLTAVDVLLQQGSAMSYEHFVHSRRSEILIRMMDVLVDDEEDTAVAEPSLW